MKTLTLKEASYHLQEWYAQNTKFTITDHAAYQKVWRSINNDFVTKVTVGNKRFLVLDKKTLTYFGFNEPLPSTHPSRQGKRNLNDNLYHSSQ